MIPSDFNIYLQQSINPLNYLSCAALPISTPSLVLAKSCLLNFHKLPNGYTNTKLIDPAQPPANKLPPKNLHGFFFESIPEINFLVNISLTEKFIAYVGKYLITFAQFPLHNDKTPSSLTQRVKQSIIPL